MSAGADPSDAAVWRDEGRFAATIGWMAAALALLVALAVPTAYFWLVRQAEAREGAVAARLHAAFVTQAIGDAGADWQQQVEGLIDSELVTSGLPERRLIVEGAGGRIVGASGPELHGPLLSQSAPIVTHDGTVGSVVVVRDLQPLLWRTGFVALLAAAVGGAMYGLMRMLPLRALRRALAELRRHEGQARARAEQQLQAVLANAAEGIVVVEADGRVALCNPAAARMLGYAESGLRGVPIARLLQLPEGSRPDAAFPVGQHETAALRRDGSAFPIEVGFSDMALSGAPQRIGIFRDVTERKQHEARLSRMANFDSLTGLPNRSLFRVQLERAIARARRSGQPFALMFLDLDRFKNINDSLGHDVGDQLLIAVARLLAGCVRDTDTVAVNAGPATRQEVFRLGGDEFTVLVEDLDDANGAAMVAQRIQQAMGRPFQIGEHELFITTSIGITVWADDGVEPDGLVKQADMAMYRAKEQGSDTFAFFDAALHDEAQQRHRLEARLRHALDRGEFLLHYQPKADVASGRVSGVEALLRWQPPGEPLVGPDRFIPILEETGLIVPVGAWAIAHACQQMMQWQRQGLRPISLAVNLSARQFRQADLIAHIHRVLAETGFDPTLLEIELTESMLIDDTDAVLRIMGGLGTMGVRIAIDDFGTGHSSLSYLKRFDVDTLKIDRSFVRDAPDDPDDSAIAIAVIALGHGLGLRVVAEGVEHAAQLRFLQQQGCDEMQGYLLSRPLAADGFARWFAAQEAARDAAPLAA